VNIDVLQALKLVAASTREIPDAQDDALGTLRDQKELSVLLADADGWELEPIHMAGRLLRTPFANQCLVSDLCGLGLDGDLALGGQWLLDQDLPSVGDWDCPLINKGQKSGIPMHNCMSSLGGRRLPTLRRRVGSRTSKLS
jgi:hypothetical protein